MAKIDYLTTVEVLAIHAIMIRKYGGISGVRDLGALEAALFRPQTGYYSDIIAQAAALMESLAINHPFLDGNKRVAFSVVDVFLRINDCQLVAENNKIHKEMMKMFDRQTFDYEHIEPWLRKLVGVKH
jgi:death-on-curing protein|uniref:type II toxin-antitoxin system death-on-curing family toxin n=1 Tax=Polynucleobacter sp. TaxID=2029855 RepID=UPI00404719D8